MKGFRRMHVFGPLTPGSLSSYSTRIGSPQLWARHSILVVALLVVAVLCLGCSKDEAPKASPSQAILEVEQVVADELQWDVPLPATNLIVIVSDTMRRDRIGAYGGPAQTPTIDMFARENFLFEEAYTQAPWTKPSIATAFTSLYPSQHGVLYHPENLRDAVSGEAKKRPIMEFDVLSEKFTTLAEVLQSSGIRTAGFVGNPWMSRSFGFAQGFELYDDSFANWDVRGDEVSKAGLAWLKTLKSGSRFFLYLHYMDCHRPFIPLDGDALNARIDELNGDQRSVTDGAAAKIASIVKRADGQSAAQAGIRPTVALAEYAYDQGVERFDGALKVFLKGFQEHPAYEQTAIVVTSDHGEALFDRGYGNHGGGLYDDEIAIPFIARLPGVSSENHRIKQFVGLVDLLPTACDYLQVAAPDFASGRSWLGEESSASQSAAACLVTEGVSVKPFNRAIRTKTYKLLWQPQGGPDGNQHELFNIREDPQETRDLLSPEFYSEEAQQVVQVLLQAGRNIIPEYTPSPTQTVPVHEDVLKRLRSLGYLGGDDDATEKELNSSGDQRE